MNGNVHHVKDYFIHHVGIQHVRILNNGVNLSVKNVRRKKIIHFRTRDDVINWAEKNFPVTHKSIHRAFREGSIEFLGGFSQIGAGHNPGWIIKVTSRFHVIYYIAVLSCSCGMLIRYDTVENIPWEYWDGDRTDNPLYQGDNPEEYRRLKNEAKKRRLNQTV